MDYKQIRLSVLYLTGFSSELKTVIRNTGKGEVNPDHSQLGRLLKNTSSEDFTDFTYSINSKKDYTIQEFIEAIKAFCKIDASDYDGIIDGIIGNENVDEDVDEDV